MTISVGPFASAGEIDAAIEQIVAELAADNERATPAALAQLREFIEAHSTSHVIDGVRYALAPDGVIREVAEH